MGNILLLTILKLKLFAIFRAVFELKENLTHVDFYLVNLVMGLTENEDISSNFEEEFIPRSPVPLPDASHCKPILVQLGFSLSKKEKKGNIMYSVWRRK